jgi:hypothetical protein
MSALGPTIIFDKSLLQSLSEDEAVWLDAFYHSIITPLFYIETLADLSKESETKSAEEIVQVISKKVPEMGPSPNTHHRELCIGDLLGYPVSFSRYPILNHGESYIMENGKHGVVYDQHPEIKAFQRWQKQEFEEIEKESASLWRKLLAEFDYDYYLNLIQDILGSDFKKPKSLEDAYDTADKIVKGHGNRYKTFKLVKDFLNINDKAFKEIVSMWNKENMIPIQSFAPYASYVLKVDIFFILCTSTGLISRDRKSNRADIAYLYYLPFTNIFTSSDKLHKRAVPLFLESDQRFIWGEDLKKDLSELDMYFDNLKSKEEKSQGVYSFAWYPPDNNRFLTTRLWDDMKPSWRLSSGNSNNKNTSQDIEVPKGLKEHMDKAYEKIKNQEGQKIPAGFDLEEANDVIIKRMVRGQRGKWQILSDNIIEAQRRKDDNSL